MRAFTNAYPRNHHLGSRSREPCPLQALPLHSLGKYGMSLEKVVSHGVQAELIVKRWGQTSRHVHVSYYLRSKSIEESLYSAPRSELDRLLGCD